ncbi:hypothetical protein AB0C33_34710 [Nonomuraea sp. NPDC048881]|uniref:hypothetical protein n=1 Tax=Nonomuraea sp. NPDC048881 TaxID=3155030 RepID=UPI003405A104
MYACVAEVMAGTIDRATDKISVPPSADPEARSSLIPDGLLISDKPVYALGILKWITPWEAPMKKMTIRRKSTQRLMAGARRLWIEWCW